MSYLLIFAIGYFSFNLGTIAVDVVHGEFSLGPAMGLLFLGLPIVIIIILDNNRIGPTQYKPISLDIPTLNKFKKNSVTLVVGGEKYSIPEEEKQTLIIKLFTKKEWE